MDSNEENTNTCIWTKNPPKTKQQPNEKEGCLLTIKGKGLTGKCKGVLELGNHHFAIIIVKTGLGKNGNLNLGGNCKRSIYLKTILLKESTHELLISFKRKKY